MWKFLHDGEIIGWEEGWGGVILPVKANLKTFSIYIFLRCFVEIF